jgi:hypothetical protein
MVFQRWYNKLIFINLSKVSKHMKIIILISIIIIFFTSCSKDKSVPNAEIIKFHPEKCGCCWGWDIKYGNDTIRAVDVIVGNTVGYDISIPIPVYIELGEMYEPCSSIKHMDFYTIKKIEKVK